MNLMNVYTGCISERGFCLAKKKSRDSLLYFNNSISNDDFQECYCSEHQYNIHYWYYGIWSILPSCTIPLSTYSMAFWNLILVDHLVNATWASDMCLSWWLLTLQRHFFHQEASHSFVNESWSIVLKYRWAKQQSNSLKLVETSWLALIYELISWYRLERHMCRV